jgi:DNA-binding HxlR family transcriptional regulator
MMNERLNFTDENCSIAATLALVGEKWSLLVLREAFFGLRRYEEFLQLTGCARNILGDRLAKLVAHGLLDRVAYREGGQRERFEYRLTEKGLDLLPILVSLMQWGDQWLAGPAGGAALVRHEQCGANVKVELRCAHGHGPLSARDVAFLPASGAKRIENPVNADANAKSTGPTA